MKANEEYFNRLLGEGTTFHVELPAVPAPKSQVDSSDTATSLKVLIVDDDPLVRELIAEVLRLEGISTDVAESAKVAREAVNGSATYSFILCDINMPLENGIQFYSRLRNDNPIMAKRFAFMSGAPTGVELVRKLGFADAPQVIAKPFDLKLLRALVHSHLSA